eukprot:14130870-Alexandrium_andersonii.AAC.1
MPVVRILNRCPRTLLAVFADDRNSIAVSRQEQLVIEQAWASAGRASALLGNKSKRARWCARLVGRAVQIEGAPSKALG